MHTSDIAEVEGTMSKRQLTALFVCSLVPWTVGNGLVPLLPIYATRLGADSTVAGLYLAFSYFAIALGAISAGWVSGSRFRRKVPLIVVGLAGVPCTWLMGQVTSIWALTILTALLWFCGGLGLALLGVLTGMSAGENERGRVFGILALTSGLGAVLGGLGTGWLVENWGYTTMLSSLAVFMLLWPLTALLLEEKEDREPRLEEVAPRRPGPLGRSYSLLFTASIMMSVSGFFIVLMRSLVMSDLGFGPLEIASTGVIGGLISMPLPALMGSLSDRIDRRMFLIFGYSSLFAALILLAFSNALWEFWLVLAFQGIATGSTSSIGNAWVTDVIPRESLGKGLALYGSTTWIGGVIGFAVSGYVLGNLGVTPTLLIGGLLALGAIGLLMPIKQEAR
jgi:MFS family permease